MKTKYEALKAQVAFHVVSVAGLCSETFIMTEITAAGHQPSILT